MRVQRALAVLWLAGSGAGAGQTVTLDTLSLYRLPGVWVQVSPLSEAAERDGLRADSLTVMIETALRDAGITVFTEDEWQVTLGNPMLFLTVNLIRPSEFLYLYNLELELRQLTTVPRDSTPVFGATWAAGDVLGTVPAPRLPSLVPRIRQMVDGFIRAYASAQGYARPWIQPRQRELAAGSVATCDASNTVESSSNSVRGSTETRPYRPTQCRWGPVTRPVAPTRPMT